MSGPRRAMVHGPRRGAIAAVVLLALLTVVGTSVAPASAFTVSAHVTPNVIRFGAPATVRGSTSLMAAGTQVRVQRRLDATTWSTRAVGTVAADGTFAVAISPTSVGIYALRAVTTVGTSPVFYLRVLGPLRIDPGGLQTLRLGMTVAQAKSTHWVTGTTGGCEFDVGAMGATFPAGIKASGEFQGGKLAWVAVNSGGSSVEGLKVGAPQGTIYSIFPGPTYKVGIVPGSEDQFGVRLYTVEKASKQIYGVTVSLSTGHITQIAAPYTPICD